MLVRGLWEGGAGSRQMGWRCGSSPDGGMVVAWTWPTVVEIVRNVWTVG